MEGWYTALKQNAEAEANRREFAAFLEERAQAPEGFFDGIPPEEAEKIKAEALRSQAQQELSPAELGEMSAFWRNKGNTVKEEYYRALAKSNKDIAKQEEAGNVYALLTDPSYMKDPEAEDIRKLMGDENYWQGVPEDVKSQSMLDMEKRLEPLAQREVEARRAMRQRLGEFDPNLLMAVDKQREGPAPAKLAKWQSAFSALSTATQEELMRLGATREAYDALSASEQSEMLKNTRAAQNKNRVDVAVGTKTATQDAAIPKGEYAIVNDEGDFSSLPPGLTNAEIAKLSEGRSVVHVTEKLKDYYAAAQALSTTLDDIGQALGGPKGAQIKLNSPGAVGQIFGRLSSFYEIAAQTNANRAMIAAQESALTPLLARMLGHTGVLTEIDVLRSEGFWPDMTKDTAAVAQMKLSKFKDYIARQMTMNTPMTREQLRAMTTGGQPANPARQSPTGKTPKNPIVL
jgi:hypothetical protein